MEPRVVIYVVALLIIGYIGMFLYRMAATRAHAEREAARRTRGKKTQHLRRIRARARGGKFQDRDRQGRSP